jgi:hypothetical protein
MSSRDFTMFSLKRYPTANSFRESSIADKLREISPLIVRVIVSSFTTFSFVS